MKDLRPTTLREYENKVLPFLGYLHLQGVSEYSEVKPAHITGFINSLKATNNPTSRLAYWRDIKRYINWLVSGDYMKVNPMAKLDTPKKSESKSHGLTKEELKAVVEAAGTASSQWYAVRNMALIGFIADSALRKGEVAALKREDLTFEVMEVGKKKVTVGFVKVKDSKSRRARTAGIGGPAVYLLRQYLARHDCEYLWVTHNGKQMDSDSIAGVVRDAMIRAGIQGKKGPHTLRHTGALLRVEDGCDTATLQRILGHANVSTTQIYFAHRNEMDVARKQCLSSIL